ncbi:MAG TPA: hypothetical protein VIA06_02285 [Candidatus Dormibacteraeota bacterium]|nr:hypothetical protein [Candidatus Dormibacteraeota bacterium]
MPEKGSLSLRRDPPLATLLDVPLTLVLEDVGYWPLDVREYRDAWRMHVQTGEPDVVCGEAACVSVEGDQVRIKSVFDSWPDVRLPFHDFEAMLDAYYQYIVERAGGENVDPEEGPS